MSTTCISGAGRAYRLESLDLEMIKSPSSTSWISNSSSPSSTLSESSNCPNSISTRKPRTPRKRPNQTYNEAAAILSTAYPKLFPAKHLTKPCKFTKNLFLFDPSPDDSSTFLLFQPQRPSFSINLYEKGCHSPGEITSRSLHGGFSYEVCENNNRDDFDAESILDEEIGEGIDSIFGDSGMGNEDADNSNASSQLSNCCYGYPVGCLGFDFGYGMRRAFRNVDEGDWWRLPCVNVVDITTPKPDKIPSEKKKKKVEKGSKTYPAPPEPSREERSIPAIQAPLKSSATDEPPPLLLKLNYESVLNAWSDKTSPFSGEEPAGNDVQVRLAQIDLFSENGGVREASVQRYKEKRRTRLFSNSKKIRYQVRKVNADRRPRMKGRFVRTPNAPDD